MNDRSSTRRRVTRYSTGATAAFLLAVFGAMAGRPIQFFLAGAAYAAAGALCTREEDSPALSAAVLTLPWLAIVGVLVVWERLAHMYPILVVVPLAAGFGAWASRTRLRRRLAATAGFAAALAVGAGFGMPNYLAWVFSPPAAPAAESGPPFTFELAGETEQAPRAFVGRVTVLDFWTTSCGVCFEEFPDLEAFSDRYADDPRVRVLAVNLADPFGDEPGEAERMMGRYDYRFEQAYADLSYDEASAAYGFRGVPAVAVYAADGRLAHVGPSEFSAHIVVNNVGRVVDRLLAE